VIQSILANFSVNIHLSTLPTIIDKLYYICYSKIYFKNSSCRSGE